MPTSDTTFIYQSVVQISSSSLCKILDTTLCLIWEEWLLRGSFKSFRLLKNLSKWRHSTRKCFLLVHISCLLHFHLLTKRRSLVAHEKRRERSLVFGGLTRTYICQRDNIFSLLDMFLSVLAFYSLSESLALSNFLILFFFLSALFPTI